MDPKFKVQLIALVGKDDINLEDILSNYHQADKRYEAAKETETKKPFKEYSKGEDYKKYPRERYDRQKIRTSRRF